MCMIVILLLAMMFDDTGSPTSAEVRAQTRLDALKILRHARQDAVQRSTAGVVDYDWTLKQIIGVQIRANDFDGALETLESYHDVSGRDRFLKELANRLSSEGKLDAAFEVLSQHSQHKSHRSFMEDEVRLHWIDQLIVQNDLKSAAEQIALLTSSSHLSEGLQKMAMAHFKSGLENLANEEFSSAINLVADSTQDMLRIAGAQLSIGKIESAKETIRKIVESAKASEAWTRCSVLAQSALILAKANDQPEAQKLFKKAVESVEEVDAMNKANAIARIAKCQAAAGYFDHALMTVSTSTEKKLSNTTAIAESIATIAIAQFESGNEDVACQTLLSIKGYGCQIEAFQKITEVQIANNEFDKAAASAEKIENPSKKALMLLKIAVALINSGDERAANEIGNRIELTSVEDKFEIVANEPIFCKEKFDFRAPESWGKRYQPGYTMASHRRSIECAAEVAGMSMMLFIKLGKKPNIPFAAAFSEFDAEVVRSLARAHAAIGNVNDALAWSKELSASKGDDEKEWILDSRKNRQIYALIGVAEGLLDRTFFQNP